MVNFKIGKGVYIWQPLNIEGGDPNKILSRLQAAGVQSVALKICDGFNVLPGLDPLIQVLRNNNILVAGWGFSYLTRDPKREAQTVTNACRTYKPNLYLIDVEKDVENNFTGAQIFMTELRPALSDLTLGLNTFWSVKDHPLFPWATFLNSVDFVCPQIYWRGADPVGKLIQAQQGYANIPNARNLPMPVVAGDLFINLGVKSPPDQVIHFLTAADTDPFIQGVFMWAADDPVTSPDLWQVFSKYKWNKGGLSIPTQPIGWAKVKANEGMNIRSAPLGSKVSGLGKNELAPVWVISDTQWAAINEKQDQWIFVGNPDYVEVALDPSKIPVPPVGIYQAKVAPTQGLNVRDRGGGTVLRALPIGTIVQIYEEKDGWGRINPTQSEWVSTKYLSKIMAPIPPPIKQG
jgi:hypothetical protein